VTVTDEVVRDVTSERVSVTSEGPGEGPGATGPGPQAGALVAARPQPAL
jgi:hypothetical protein